MNGRVLLKLISPLGFADFAVVLAFLTLCIGAYQNFAVDPGVGWHLATGQSILSSGQIPYADPFLASEQIRSWVSDQWLSDLIFAWLFKLGSWPLLYAFLSVVFIATYFFLLYWGGRLLSGSVLTLCLSLMFVFKLGQIHFILRPVVLTFFCFTILVINAFFIARAFRQTQQTSPITKRQYIFLPLLFLIWANLHPAFMMGLMLLSLIPVGLMLDYLFSENRAQESLLYTNLKRITLLILGCFLATLINPYVWNLHQSILSLASSQYFMDLHNEWKSPNFKNIEGQYLQIILASIFLALFVRGREALKWGWFEILLVLFLTKGALQAVRVLPFFGIGLAILLTESWSALSAKLLELLKLEKGWLAGLFQGMAQREVLRTNSGQLILALGSVLILVLACTHSRLLFYNGPFGPAQKSYPYKSVEFVRTAAQHDSKTAVVAATPNWGGFITFFGEGRLKPLLDDRNSLVGEEFHKKFMDSLYKVDQNLDFFKSLGANYLLLGAKDPRALFIKERGKMPVLFEDEVAIVFGYER